MRPNREQVNFSAGKNPIRAGSPEPPASTADTVVCCTPRAPAGGRRRRDQVFSMNKPSVSIRSKKVWFIKNRKDPWYYDLKKKEKKILQDNTEFRSKRFLHIRHGFFFLGPKKLGSSLTKLTSNNKRLV